MEYQFWTTPIFYPNDKPHLGTAYTLILADFFKRYYQSKNCNIILSTGTDEHGKKIYDTALSRGLTPQDHVNIQRNNFLRLKNDLNLNWDFFINTTDENHIKNAQEIWMFIYNKGLIYKGFYKGWYSKKDEQYFKEDEIIDGKAPNGSDVQLIQEECYFFKLKDFKEKLLSMYANNPQLIQPQWRLKELINNITHHNLEDLCISRAKEKLSWGITVPHDENHCMYVWFDALINYITVLKYYQKDHYNEYINNMHHIIGKDILYFHGIIWPAMLMAAEIPIFTELLVHGWLTVDNEKMSKSVGNVIDPIDLCQTIKSDYLKFFLLREIPISSDYNFDLTLLYQRINEELADKIGNLINRVTVLTIKYNEGIIIPTDNNFNINDKIMDQWVTQRKINDYCQNIIHTAHHLNKYLEEHKPWDKNCTKSDINDTLWYLWQGIYGIGRWLYPVTPNFSNQILKLMDCQNYNENIAHKKIIPQGILIEKFIFDKN